MSRNNREAIKKIVKETVSQMSDKDILDEEITLGKGGNDNGNGNDSIFKHTRGPEHIRRLQEAVDETAIDELMLSVPKNEGWYIKIEKEIRPGEWQYKLRINDDWHKWGDLQYEISRIVQEYSRRSPEKWGTATYRIVWWKEGGIRGSNYKPIELHIDAQEELTNPQGQYGRNNDNGNASANSVAETLDSIKSFIDPTEFQKRISDAFQSGQQSKASDSSSTVAIFTSMMQAMMQMQQQASQQQTQLLVAAMEKKHDIPVPVPIDNTNNIISIIGAVLPLLKETGLFAKADTLESTLGKLQVLGLMPKPEDNDPVKKLTDMKNVLEMVQSISGGSIKEKSSMEVITDALQPFVPKILDTVNNAIELNKPRIGTDANQLGQSGQSQIQAQVQPQQQAQDEMLKQFLVQLKNAIGKQEKSFFPFLKQVITGMQGGPQLIDAVLKNQISQEQLMSMIQTFGTPVGLNDSQYTNAISAYLKDFIVWVQRGQSQEQTKYEQSTQVPIASVTPITSPEEILTKCNKCGTMFMFASIEEFNALQIKKCTETVQIDSYGGSGECEGTLEIRDRKAMES